jgi:hypothetical protein
MERESTESDERETVDRQESTESPEQEAGGRQERSGATADTDDEQYTDREDRLALYEWVGGLAAALGFFLTPLFTGPVAGYCALELRREKPLVASLILAVVFATAVFWLVVLVFVIIPTV